MTVIPFPGVDPAAVRPRDAGNVVIHPCHAGRSRSRNAPAIAAPARVLTVPADDPIYDLFDAYKAAETAYRVAMNALCKRHGRLPSSMAKILQYERRLRGR